jgi:hypothetical protein
MLGLLGIRPRDVDREFTPAQWVDTVKYARGRQTLERDLVETAMLLKRWLQLQLAAADG